MKLFNYQTPPSIKGKNYLEIHQYIKIKNKESNNEIEGNGGDENITTNFTKKHI